MNLKIYEKTKYPNIYKHIKNGTYAVDLSLGYNFYGKRVRTTTTGIKTEKEAKIILSNEENKKKKKIQIIECTKFEDNLEEYYDWCLTTEKTSKETMRRKKGRFNLHMIPFFKGMKLELIDESTILSWHKYLMQKTTIGPVAKNTIHKQLSAYFNWILLHKKIITFNPCKAVENFKIPPKNIEYRTIEEMQKLWDSIVNDTFYSEEIKLRIIMITKFLFFTGFRIGEFMGLKFSDFDFDILNMQEINKDEITLNLCRSLYYGKGGWIENKGKTKESLGYFIIGKNTLKPLFDYVKYMQKNICEFTANDYILINPDKEKVFSIETIRKQLNYYCKIAGLEHTKFKDMRSSNGTFLLSHGYSLEEVQERLRHSRKETTEKYYATFYYDNKKRIANEIDKYV